MSKQLKEIIVKQDEQNPVPVEVLATSIKAIAEGVRKLRAGPLNEKALVLLISHACPMLHNPYRRPNAKEVRAVIEGMDSLGAVYLKKKPKP